MRTMTFTFTLPPDAPRQFGDNGRDMLARALDGATEADRLFHYRDGKPCGGGMPLVRISSRKDRLSIVSLSADTDRIVLDSLPHICDGIAALCGNSSVVNIRTDETCANYSERPYFYRARDIVVARGLDACAKFEAMTPVERRDAVHRAICSGLERQANELMLDLPDMPSSVGTEITFLANRAKLIVSEGKVREHGVVASALFCWNARIKGSWAVGRLTSRGHGRIWYAKEDKR